MQFKNDLPTDLPSKYFTIYKLIADTKKTLILDFFPKI